MLESVSVLHRSLTSGRPTYICYFVGVDCVIQVSYIQSNTYTYLFNLAIHLVNRYLTAHSITSLMAYTRDLSNLE